MAKKSITIGLITFMVLALAAPLFSTGDGTSPCCKQVEMNCCIQQEINDCPMSINSCEIPVALLLISGPKPHTSQNVELTVSQLGDVTFCDPDYGYIITSDIQNSSASPPISFLTPLRI
ncbi:MAG: hypothetical protein ACE5D0_06525 [Fidelibacterota bacterium]